MTDPIDTSRPINLAEVIKAIRGKVIAVGDGRDFSYGLDTLDHALPTPAGWTWDQIEAAASQADTARQEGIALGLAMAKAAPTYDRNFDTMERVDYGAWISVDDIPDPPIPPHVAAARVLLDMPPNKDGLHVLPDHMRAALEQIAKEGA